jgi:hypothetical protein
MLLRARMPVSIRPFWALHVIGALALLPAEVHRAYRLPPRLPRGRATQRLVALALGAIDLGFFFFGPVRRARARLRAVERAFEGTDTPTAVAPDR